MQSQQAGRMSQEALLTLWRRYKDTGDTTARDRLVFSLAPIVKCIVYRKVREIPGYREVDDFISCGLEALIRSIDRYDPEKGATLEQFAWTRIHGAVLDELRRQDWAPRSLRRREREIAAPVSASRSCTAAAAQPEELADRWRSPSQDLRRRDGRHRPSPTSVAQHARDLRATRRPCERIDTLAGGDRPRWTPSTPPLARRKAPSSAPPSTSFRRASARSRCCCT